MAGKRVIFPPLTLICVDAAHVVWAIPTAVQDDPGVEGRNVGVVHKIGRGRARGMWGYEHKPEDGMSDQLYHSPTEAAEALLQHLGPSPAKRPADQEEAA